MQKKLSLLLAKNVEIFGKNFTAAPPIFFNTTATHGRLQNQIFEIIF
jgi:hypothetical protein